MDPCIDYCFNHFGKEYTKDCDNNCEYAKAIAENKKLQADLAHVTAERNWAIEYVRGQCKYCKHNFICTSRKGPHFNCWEWRGIKEN